ncbi:MAG: hypothetical protein ACRCX2_00885 [Paraclostridium sp.]
MTINRKKFDEFYEFSMDSGILKISRKNKKGKYLFFGKTIYLAYTEETPSTDEEKQKLIEAGLVDKTTTEELYKELIGLTDIQVIEKREQMDIRSYNYLQAIYNNLGFIKYELDKKELKKYYLRKIKMDSFHNADLFKIDDEYIIEFGTFCPPDDYFLTQIYLSKEPTDNFFKILNNIDKATDLLARLKSFNENRDIEGTLFKCRTCNKITHWLDNNYDFKTKVDMLSNFECCI